MKTNSRNSIGIVILIAIIILCVSLFWFYKSDNSSTTGIISSAPESVPESSGGRLFSRLNLLKMKVQIVKNQNH
jgi:hypothetical protein